MEYKCKENNVVIENHEDEIWISVEGDTKCGKTVVGLKDLKQALILFGVSFSEAEVCPTCNDVGWIMCDDGKNLCPDCGCSLG